MKLTVRADANAAIGAGHVMRTLALAQQWRDRGGAVQYLCAELSPALRTRLRDEGIDVRDLAVERGSDADLDATDAATAAGGWVVLDGYRFDERWHRRLRRAGRRVLCVDDYAQCARWNVDVVLNPHAYGDAAMYPDRGKDTVVLAGPRAILLRREFGAAMTQPPDVRERVETVLVSLGAADPAGLTPRVVALVRAVFGPSVRIMAVIGQSASASLREATRAADADVEILESIDDMASVMRAADLAVVASGGTVWECMACRLPFVAIRVVDNQDRLAAWLRGLGWLEVLDAAEVATSLATSLPSMVPVARRQRFVDQAQALLPHSPVARIVDRLESFDLVARPVTLSDARRLFDWANDPDTRRFSVQTAQIPWEGHLQWLQNRLSRTGTHFVIVEAPLSGALGQVRYDRGDDGWWVSISLDRDVRGRGFALPVLQAADAALRDAEGPVDVHATVRIDNVASLALFAAAGFVPTGEVERNGARFRDLVLRRAQSLTAGTTGEET